VLFDLAGILSQGFQLDHRLFGALHAAQRVGDAQTRRPGERRRRIDHPVGLDRRLAAVLRLHDLPDQKMREIQIRLKAQR